MVDNNHTKCMYVFPKQEYNKHLTGMSLGHRHFYAYLFLRVHRTFADC